MNTSKVSKLFGLITGGIAAILFSLPASANFYVDYQGMEHKLSTDELRKLRGAPEGYRILADKTYGIVHQIGKGNLSNTSSFGADMPLKDAISMLMPAKWIAYIDENIDIPSKVDWQATEEPWVDVLGRVGVNYGYRFVVDWDQKLLQISSDKDFVAPDYNDPISLKDPESGRTIFVYSAKPVSQGGFILIDGKIVPVKLDN